MAATYPKDLVIMIDKSQPMTSHFGKDSKLYYAIKAAQSVIDTLNPNDHVSKKLGPQNVIDLLLTLVSSQCSRCAVCVSAGDSQH